eukprot:scaffold587_cov77-Cylindrotheca_fusiformis.AAC.1
MVCRVCASTAEIQLIPPYLYLNLPSAIIHPFQKDLSFNGGSIIMLSTSLFVFFCVDKCCKEEEEERAKVTECDSLHSHNLGPYHDDNKATFSKSQACAYWWLYCCRPSNNNNNNYVLPLQARRRHHHHHENDGYDDDNGNGKQQQQQHGENVSVSVGNKKKSLMLPPPCQELASILKEVKLPLEPISDLGYYGWKPELRIQQQQQQTAMEAEQQMKKKSNGSPRMRIVVASTIPLPHVTANDIRRNVHLNETPRIPCDLKAFRDSLPRNVTMVDPNDDDDDDDDDDTIASPAAAATTTLILPNKYPYGQTSIASLYAAKQKGVPLEE